MALTWIGAHDHRLSEVPQGIVELHPLHVLNSLIIFTVKVEQGSVHCFHESDWRLLPVHFQVFVWTDTVASLTMYIVLMVVDAVIERNVELGKDN